MNDPNIQEQIDQMNQKVDLILQYVNQQRLKSESVEDLISDISIVGKDVYDTAVAELENQAVELDPAELKNLSIRLLKNVGTFNEMIGMLESVSDFMKDAGPIANEMIIDFTRKLHEFEEKGYFDFMAEIGTIIDNIITHFTKDDIRQLADNIVTILETVKSLTQPEMLNSINNAVRIYGSLEMDSVPEYSIWKLMREMNKPEMKKALGFAVSFMKNLSQSNDNLDN
jgi:uncharacterized protein YjgD (DUF1641 family)